MQSLVNKTIENYRITSVIGQGGMGVVYRAEDTGLRRSVAIKMLSPSLAQDEEFLQRFRTEATALANLDHPNIVRVYALERSESGIFLVMELIDGQSVSTIVRQKGAIGMEAGILILKEALAAIEFAHASRIIHRGRADE